MTEGEVPPTVKKKICWHHQNHLVNKGQPDGAYPKGTCRFDHGPPMKKEDFDKLRAPSKPPGKNKTRAKTPAKEYKLVGDVKIPVHCRTFKETGKCKWEADNPGKTCNITHMTKAAYDAKHKPLNP